MRHKECDIKKYLETCEDCGFCANYQDKIYQLLIKCNKNVDTPDLHSFTANIRNGTVYVDCRGYEVYMEVSGETKSQWVGTILAATNRLERLGIDLSTVEI